MISCLPSLCLVVLTLFKDFFGVVFVGEFSAVALMEARDKQTGAVQSPCPGTSSVVCKHFCPSPALAGTARSTGLREKEMGSCVGVGLGEEQAPPDA